MANNSKRDKKASQIPFHGDSANASRGDWWEENAQSADPGLAEKTLNIYVKRGAESLLRIESLNKNGNLVRGAVVTKDVKKGQVLLKIPAREVVDHQNIIASEIGYVFGGETNGTERKGIAPRSWFAEVDHVESMIVLYMMWMAVNPESFDHDYGVLLQSTDSPLKYIWNPEEEAIAAGGEVLRTFRAAIQYDIHLMWDLIVQPLKVKNADVFDGPHYSYYNFTRWYSLYRSRSVVSKTNMVMVPILDLINYGSQPNCEHEIMPNGDWIVTATRDLSTGEELILAPLSNYCNEWFHSFWGYQEKGNSCSGFVDQMKRLASFVEKGQYDKKEVQPLHRNAALPTILRQIEGVGSSISERPRYWKKDEKDKWSRGLLVTTTTTTRFFMDLKL